MDETRIIELKKQNKAVSILALVNPATVSTPNSVDQDKTYVSIGYSPDNGR